MNEFIRPFRAQDGELLPHIGAETAFFCPPIEAFMQDRRIFFELIRARTTRMYSFSIDRPVGTLCDAMGLRRMS